MVGLNALARHLQPQAIKARERGQVRAIKGSIGHVEVFQMDGVGTPIIGRPRPLPSHDTPNPAHNTYTLKCEEPVKSALAGNGSSGSASDGATNATGAASSAPVVSAVGLITNPASAEQILVTNQADIVEVGRPALANPRLPLSWAKELGVKLDYMPPQYARGF